jgi:uncharacterized membrane protein YjgN (DUF898 family)
MTSHQDDPRAGNSDLFIDSSLTIEEDEAPPPKAPPPSPKQASSHKINPIGYDGRLGEVYKIWLVNLLLNIVTIGIYSFWGKTRMRRYVVGSFALDDDFFEYSGTGKELFIGFLKAIPILLLIYGPFLIATGYAGEEAAWPLLFLLPLIYFIGIAIFAATRYRMSRTSWRGIRGHLTGSALAYANLHVWRLFLNIISFGILIPYSDIAKHRKIVDQTFFGDIQAEYTATARPLMAIHIITGLLFVPTLGMSRLWYRAALMRHKMIGIYAGDYRFKSDVTGLDLLKLNAGNVVLIVFTLGLAFPVVIQRNMRFFAEHNFVGGDLRTDRIKQAAEQQAGVGEGLDDILDMDTGFMG